MELKKKKPRDGLAVSALVQAAQKHKCADCGVPTDLRGWMFKLPRKGETLRKIYYWWCNDHFRIWMFNLYPYACTSACRRKHWRYLGIKPTKRDGDGIVWLNLLETMSPRKGACRTGACEPVREPKCPWCGKSMKLVTRLLKKKKA